MKRKAFMVRYADGTYWGRGDGGNSRGRDFNKAAITTTKAIAVQVANSRKGAVVVEGEFVVCE